MTVEAREDYTGSDPNTKIVKTAGGFAGHLQLLEAREVIARGVAGWSKYATRGAHLELADNLLRDLERAGWILIRTDDLIMDKAVVAMVESDDECYVFAPQRLAMLKRALAILQGDPAHE